MNQVTGDHEQDSISTTTRAIEQERRPHLLLVDDEPSILMSLAAVLKYSRPGYSLDTASSAEEALWILESKVVDLLITDLKLPKMDGLALVQTTLMRNPDTRSILITAFGTDSVDYGAYRSGCVNYLEKPFDVDRLLKSIDETLAQESNRPRPSSTLVQSVCAAGAEKLTTTIKVVDENAHGLIIMADELIEYADYNGLVGINALVAMLSLKEPRIECIDGAPELNNADLPVTWQAFEEAASTNSQAQQIAFLREDGRRLRDETCAEYPMLDFEAGIQREMLAELVQRQRENVLDLELHGQLKRKRLHFHQTLSAEMVARQVQLRKMVNLGIEYYSEQYYEQARTCWLEALEIDPNCQQAKHNLDILYQTLEEETHIEDW